MLYGLVRAAVGTALRLFYRVEVVGPLPPAAGPLLLLANHPNALLDPALVFVATHRHVTFLAKEPLFRTPVIGTLLRGLGALPVYRKQDLTGPSATSDMARNEATFQAATQALVGGHALMLFPEGRSHSEPALAELKTGAARIALRAQSQGAQVQLIPVGLTYAAKGTYRSAVRVELGVSLPQPAAPVDPADQAQVRALTAQMDAALRKVTLNLDGWEDLPVLRTADALYSLRRGEPHEDAERLRRFARGMALLREHEPAQYRALRRELVSFRHRLDLVAAEPQDLPVVYRRGVVYAFALRNLAALFLGLPLFCLGLVLFFLPFQIPRGVARAVRAEEDVEGTVKFLATLAIAPLWQALLVGTVAWRLGGWAALATPLVTVPLALFTRYFYEHRARALRDVRVFFALGRRSRLKARLLAEGESLAREIERTAERIVPALEAVSD